MKKITALSFCIICNFLFFQTKAFSQIVINEVSTSNASTLLDEDGDANDWVELYSANSVNLGDYSLSDKLGDLSKWSLPNIVFGNTNNHYLIVMLSGKNKTPGTFYHSNFSLSKGEKIILYDHVTSVIIDSLTPQPLQVDHSMGRNINGVSGTWSYFNTPTPGTSNSASTAYSGYEPEPLFSVVGGLYNSSQTIAITSTSPTSIIRYTLDGSIPTNTSAIYSSPINLSSTKVLSAKCFSSSNKLESKDVKNTYLINESGLGNLSVFSLTKTSDSPLGTDELLSHFEYFDKKKNKTKQLEGDCGITIEGHGTAAFPQQTMRLHFRKIYGTAAVNYELIPEKPFVTNYSNGITLRNGGNGAGFIKFTDAMNQRILKNTHVDYCGYEPAVVFLNGQYWGEYEIREILDNDYLANNHSMVDATKVDLLTYNLYQSVDVLSGTSTAFDNMKNYAINTSASSNLFYDQINSMIDMDNYVDYFAGEIFLCNQDWIWPNFNLNNIKLWRSQLAGGKWRYILRDMDSGINVCNLTTGPYQNMINIVRTSYEDHAQIFTNIMRNTKFKNQFINRSADLMNTIFQPEVVQNIITPMRDSVVDAMPRNWAKWDFGADINGLLPWFKQTSDLDYALSLIPNWITQRLAYNRDQYQSEFGLAGQVNITLNANPVGAGKIQINTIVPELTPTWTGVYFHGVPVTITAIPNPGYTFTNWTNNANISNLNLATFTADIASAQTFTANFTGSVAATKITISEINYHSDSTVNAGDWIELHNYDVNNSINISSWLIKNSLDADTYTIPLNTVIPANGYVVFCSDTTAFKLQHPGITNYVGQLPFVFSNNEDQVRLFDPSFNIKSSVSYSSKNAWPKGADGMGRTLELVNPTTSLDLASNWFDGCMGGSPGTGYSPCNDAIVISEINYKSSALSDAGDWIELHNTTSNAINLSGWRFRNSGTNNIFTFPNGISLAANAYLVLLNDSTKFKTIHPSVANYIGKFSFGLSSSGDELKLYNNSTAYSNTGVIQFSMVYDNKSPWPTAANGEGKTLELTDATGHINDGANWFAGCLDGSPGTLYTPCASGVHEEMNQDSFTIYPNPFTLNTTITFMEEQKNCIIKITDVLGKDVRTINFSGKQLVIDKNEMLKGVYFVHVIQNEKPLLNKKIIVQ